MRELGKFGILLLLWMFSNVIQCDDNVNGFIRDVISTFGLISPTIIYHENAPEICFTNQWVLCLNNENEQAIFQEGTGTATPGT